MKNILKKISNFFRKPEKEYKIETTYILPDFITIQRRINKFNNQKAHSPTQKRIQLEQSLAFDFGFQRFESNSGIHWMFLEGQLHYWPTTGTWIACYDGSNPQRGRRVYGAGLKSFKYFLDQVVVEKVQIEVSK